MVNYSYTLITDNVSFSLKIRKYFLEKGKIKHKNVDFNCFGLDEKKDAKEILNTIQNTAFVKSKENVKYIIFTDIGPSFELGKQMYELDSKNVLLSNSSVLESGFLAYIMANTFAPLKSIMKFIEHPIHKDKIEY